MLNRIKAKLLNTELRIEYILPDDSNRGLAVIIKIGHISYENEAGKELKAEDQPATSASQLDKDFDEESVARGSNNKDAGDVKKDPEKEVYYLSAYAIHHISLMDIAIYTEEFTIVDLQQEKRHRKTTHSSSMSSDGSEQSMDHQAMMMMGGGGGGERILENSMMSEQFFSTISEFPIPELQQSVIASDGEADDGDQSEEEDRGSGMKIYSSGELQIAALNGLHEMRLSMKQSDSVVGANVELEVNLGVLELLLTPRQVHMISTILESFSLPHGSAQASSSLTGNQNKSKNRTEDHRNTTYESPFRSQFNNMSGGFSYGQPSEPPRPNIPASRMDFRSPSELRSNLGLESIMTSSSTSSSISSASTMVNSSTARSSRRRRRGSTVGMNQDYDSVLISTYVCRIGGVVAVLLHDDILMDTQAMASMCYGPPVTEQSGQQMQMLCGEYFSKMKQLNLVAELRQMATVEQQHLDNIVTPQYHLRLLMATIILEGEERRNPKENLLHFNGSVARVKLTESLNQLKVPLLDFYASPGDLTRVPNVQVTYQSLQRVHLLNGIEYLSDPVVKCKVCLSQCNTELDISIYDRLKVLSESYPFQFASSGRVKMERQEDVSRETRGNRRRSSKKQSQQSFSLTLNFDRLDVNLRFPVADLRPVHDPQRVPWWERNVRSDYMVVRLRGARVASVKTDIVSIESDELHLFYVENELVPVLVPLGTCGGRVDADTQLQHVPSIIIDMSEVQEAMQPGQDLGQGPPTPFARSKACRESDTPHRKGPSSGFGTADDSEVLVMPGNREELRTFTEFALKNSKMRVSINLPRADVQLKSKHIYELLYNRVNSDLLMWTPGSHQLVVPANNSGAGDLLLNFGLMDSVYAPSVSHEIEDSDEEEDDDVVGGAGSDDDDTNYGFSSDQSDEMTFKSINQRRRQERSRRRRRHRNRAQQAVQEVNTNECDFAFCLQVSQSDNQVIHWVTKRALNQ